ncbi:MAG: hypothetical protein CL446_02675 [Acidimicrobiaceae bacterium]|nr:hypothetical protein [Acidimicrobiaceae bacterium]
MDLRQLGHLLAVVEHRSFSAAARALHTVQSNVSTHVAKLEKELGIVLIDRHSMEPTAEGSAVVERARRIRTELQAIEDDIVSMRHEVAGEVRIGCISTTGRWMATTLLGELSARHPALRPVLVDAPTTSLAPRVLDGDLDMAVVNTPVVEAGLETEPLFDEERILVVPSRHPLAGAETIDVATLASYPVMLTPIGTTFRDAIDQELETVGVRLQAAAEVDGLRLLASLAYQGYAPALLPASAVSDYPAGEWSLVYVDGLARRSVGLVRNRRTTPSMPVMATKDVLCDVIRENGPRQPGIHVTLGT